MGTDRVISWNELLRGPAPVRQREPQPRALVLVEDPLWLHEGLTYRLTVRGKPNDFFPVGRLAEAMNRAVGTVRRLEQLGVLPVTKFRTPSRTAVGQRRLYRREELLAVRESMQRLNLLEHRPERLAGHELREELARIFATA